MRKSNTKFHSKRSSSRKAKPFGTYTVDVCPETHRRVNDTGFQLMNNPLLNGLIHLAAPIKRKVLPPATKGVFRRILGTTMGAFGLNSQPKQEVAS